MFGSQRSPHIKPITFTISSHFSPLHAERWLLLLTYVTPARDLTQFNSTHRVELIKLIFRIFPKVQLFEVPRNQGVITWYIYDFFCSHWVSFFDQPSSIASTRLTILQFQKLQTQRVSPLVRKKIKKDFSYFSKALDRAPYPANVMPRPLACPSPRRNPFSANEDERAGAVPAEGNGTPTSTPVMSLARTPGPATGTATALSSDTELFKQFMKAYLEVQVPSQTGVDSEPRKQSLKARFPDLYYGNSHMDCYWICQQWEEYFKTARAKGPKRIPFGASFLRGSVT